MAGNRKQGAGEKVVAQLKELLVGGQLQPGSRLPPERDLAETLGVSRSSLREGIKSLESMGVLEVRHGSGAVVAADARSVLDGPFAMVMLLDRPEHEELYEVRRPIEREAARLASQRRTPQQLEEMSDCLRSMEVLGGDPHASVSPNARFHALLAEMSGNRILNRIMASLMLSIEEAIEDTNLAGRNPMATLEVHRRIYTAILNQDPEGAQTAVDAHMDLALSELSLLHNRNTT